MLHREPHPAGFLPDPALPPGRPDGADVINTFNGKPATLSLGTGPAGAGHRARLIGLAEGAHSLRVPAGDAFGERNPELLQRVKLSLLHELGDPDATYAVGDVVQFPTPDGQGSYAGVVREARPDWLLFDFNHPLAGQPVRFEVQVLGVLMTTSRPWTRCCWPSRAASAPASTAPSRSSSARCSASARPIYVRHEIVHNTYVVNDLKAKGAIFIEDLADVPPGATLIFSAHGVSKAVRDEAARAASRSSTPPARW
jgi:FKBP-type peptidyl-prolyl cis-trans isomerase SlpA